MFAESGAIIHRPLLSTAAPLSERAAGWSCGIVRVRAERAQTVLCWNTDHGKRSGLMLAVERRGLGWVEVAAGQSRSIFGVVEPETQMESIRRSQAHVGIKTEDIIQKNRLDLNVAVIRVLANLDIGLIPGQTKASREIGVFGAIGLKETILDREQIKRETRLDPIQIQNECVIELAANYRGAGARLLKRIGTKAVNDRRVRQQVEADLVLLVLGGGDAGDGENCARRQQAASDPVSGCATPELLTAVIIHFFLLLFRL